ncbi:MAG: aspartyl protease family protein [Janthinobacterium lividum]
MIRGRLAGLAAATLLAVGVAMPASGQSCQRGAVATTLLRDDDGFITMSVGIGGRAASMLVDTGSDGGLFTELGADRLLLARDPSRRTVMQGTGGTGRTVPNVFYSDLAIGGWHLPGGSMPVGGLPGMPVVTPPVAGLIGADVLSQFDVEFDLQRHRIVFWRIRSASLLCLPPPAWDGAFDTIPLDRHGNRLTFAAKLNGVAITALVDTGARSRILSRRAAARLGVDADRLDGDPGGITAGVDLHETSYHWHRFKTLTIGGETQRRPVLTVAPLDEQADLLLGADWFAIHDVWISYATNRMFVRAETAAK